MRHTGKPACRACTCPLRVDQRRGWVHTHTGMSLCSSGGGVATPPLVTRQQRAALLALQRHGKVTPSGLANALWPTSTTRMSMNGRGAQAGVGANLKAGQFLHRLHELGYTVQEHRDGYTLHALSPEGEALVR